MTARISVIVPTYNRVEYIGETLDSLLAQTQPVGEIWVIDDGSTDGTADYVAGLGDKVQYLAKPNGGKSSALNAGLDQVSGEFIWICDDDDVVLPDASAQLIAPLLKDPGLGYCAGLHDDFMIAKATGKKTIKRPGYRRRSAPDEIFPDLLDGCHIFQPGLLVRRSSYDLVGPFDEKLTRSQDYEMLLRLARATRGILLDGIVFHHREHDGDRGSAKQRFSTADSNARWIEFHRVIMEPLIPDLADAEILPDSIWNNPTHTDTRHRTALLKRASVYARSQLWPEAAETWAQAAQQFDGPLNRFETDIVKGATLYSLGCDGLLEDETVRSTVLDLKHQSVLGREITALLGRSLRWRIKQAVLSGQLRRAATLTRFLIAAA